MFCRQERRSVRSTSAGYQRGINTIAGGHGDDSHSCTPAPHPFPTMNSNPVSTQETRMARSSLREGSGCPAPTSQCRPVYLCSLGKPRAPQGHPPRPSLRRLSDFLLLRYETEHKGPMLHCKNDLHDRLHSHIVQRSNSAFPGCCFLGRFLPKLGGASRCRLLFANWMRSSTLRPSGAALRVARHHPCSKTCGATPVQVAFLHGMPAPQTPTGLPLMPDKPSYPWRADSLCGPAHLVLRRRRYSGSSLSRSAS